MKQASILLLGLAASASAAVVKTADYSLDFGTSAANAAPFFTDSIGGHNVTGNQAATVSAATGSISPAGGGGVTVNGDGLHSNAVPFGYTTDWGISLWVRANNNTSGQFMQGDNAATGAYLARNADGSFGFGGVPGTTTTPQATVGTWYRVTMINYGNQMTYFVDQTRIATGVTAGSERTLNAPMFNFASGGQRSIGSASYDHIEVYKFDSATDSLTNVQATMGVPEPSVALLGGLAALALLRRRRA